MIVSTLEVCPFLVALSPFLIVKQTVRKLHFLGTNMYDLHNQGSFLCTRLFHYWYDIITRN